MDPVRALSGPVGPSLDLQPVRFRVERFEYAPAELLLRLSLRVSRAPSRTGPMLFIERDGREHAYTPLLSCTGAAPADGGDWLWRGAFAVPAELVSPARGSYVLSLREDLLLALPEPDVRKLREHGAPRRQRNWRGWPYALRRTGLLLLVTCPLLLAPALSPAAALSDASPAGAPGEGTPEALPPPSEGPGEPGQEAPPEQPGGGQPGPETPAPPVGEPTPPVPQAPPTVPDATPGEPPVDAPSITPRSDPALAGANAVTPDAAAPADTLAPSRAAERSSAPRHAGAPTRRLRGSGSPRRSHHRRRRPADRRRGAPLVAHPPAAASPPTLQPAEVPTLLAGLQPALLVGSEEGPPAYLIPIYEQAGHRYHVPWRVLAAINGIETDYGRNLAVSPAGAVGFMQFMPGTWREWAVDADHDGRLDPYSPRDAIFTAARYLGASGAARDLAGAIFAYNHADWYVADVLLRARMLVDVAGFGRVEQGYSLPLDPRYMQQFGRTDDGVDIETAPDGALVYSITAGVVSAVASDPAGFGPDYPVIEATSGSLAGQHIYYGHVAAALVQPGQQVQASQPIAIVGHTGDALSLGHGHIEIGFCDAAGDPLSHHGARAWTPAGAVMRSFLGGLSSDFRAREAR